MDGKLNCHLTAENAAFTKLRHLENRVTETETRIDVLEQEATQLDEALQNALENFQEAVVTENVDTGLLRADSIGTAILTTDDIITGEMTANFIEAETINVDSLNAEALRGKIIDTEEIISTTAQFTETQTTTANSSTTNTAELNVDGETSLTGQVNIAGNVTFTRDNGLSKIQGNYLEIDVTQFVANTATIDEAQLGENSVLNNPTFENIKQTQEVSSTCIDLDEDGKFIRVNIGSSTEVVSTALKSVVDDVEKVNISAEGAVFNVPVTMSGVTSIENADTITVNNLSANAITTGDVDSDTINAATLAANTITTENISISDTANADKVEANTVKANVVESNTVKADTVESNTVEANAVEANVVEANTINATDGITAENVSATGLVQIDGMTFYRGNWYDKIVSTSEDVIEYILDTTDKREDKIYNILFCGESLSFNSSNLPATPITASEVVGKYKVHWGTSPNSEVANTGNELSFLDAGYDPLVVCRALLDKTEFYGFDVQLDIISKNTIEYLRLNNCTLNYKDFYSTGAQISRVEIKNCNNVNVITNFSWYTYPRVELHNCNGVQMRNWNLPYADAPRITIATVESNNCYAAIVSAQAIVNFGQIGYGNNLVVRITGPESVFKQEPAFFTNLNQI